MSSLAGEPRLPWRRRVISDGEPFRIPDPDDPPDQARSRPAGSLHAGLARLRGPRRDRTRPAAEPGRFSRTGEKRLAATDPAELGARLVARMRESGHDFFIRTVLGLLAADGYQSPDGHRMTLDALGHTMVQGVIWHDPYDTDPLFVVCRKVGIARTVGLREIEVFAREMSAQPTSRGCVVTTGRFTQEAREYAAEVAERVTLRLIDQRELGELMIRHRCGVRRTLDVDEAFFEVG
ncbi:restriction endonuclease [Phytomonospora sp. NPDC050363]|uniref:restriction endonuclease n=1 Tax=Phytomonospora sp. NPDC050363 TaxID=3155642 RepID=UPI0033C3FE78